MQARAVCTSTPATGGAARYGASWLTQCYFSVPSIQLESPILAPRGTYVSDASQEGHSIEEP